MSIWTHVAGVVRYDGWMPGKKADYIEKILKPVLGKTVAWEDETATWDACDVPQGSEGSLQYTIKPGVEDKVNGNITVGDTNLAVVTITGDLRDFEPEDWGEIEGYFKRITENLPDGCSVRQAVLAMESYGKQKTLTFKEDKS